MAKEEKRYTVIAQTTERATGLPFGPFDNMDAAESCVIALAGRMDIKSATIQEAE